MTLRKEDIETLNLSAAWGRGNISPGPTKSPTIYLYNNSLVGSPKILLLDKIIVANGGVSAANLQIEGAEINTFGGFPTGTFIMDGLYKADESVSADGEIYTSDNLGGVFERANRPLKSNHISFDAKEYEFKNPIVILREKAWGVLGATEEKLYVTFEYRIIPE